MSKLKTHRGAAKRFKKTGSGGYKHRQSFRNHILTKKSSKRKTQLRAMQMVSESDILAIRQMLPNG
ncbi:MAG: ribosomal protein [Francisellaceae bacterium]|nr:ribosomal protein [Francisellaceae bacterium]